MSVEFDENNTRPANYAESTPKLAGWLIEHGVAKDLEGANRMQVIAAVVIIAVALFIFFK
jgi:hypothetical protein